MADEPQWRDDDLREALAIQGFVWEGSLPPVGWFGDSPELASELGELVRLGHKTATAGLLWVWEADHGGPPSAGQREVVIDWVGRPLAVIELTEVSVTSFLEVDSSFAADEGEGDGTLDFWRNAHRSFFRRECSRLGRQFHDDVAVVCMRFRVLHAAPDAAA
ncbi:MAG: ASCH domain-containing protein [Longimicrobiales bacterium]